MNSRRAIDWFQVKARLQASQAAIEQLAVTDPVRQERVFRERAEQLAVRRTVDGARSTAWPALVFALGSERFCLPLSVLTEVLPFTRCSPLPGAAPELLGVINVRGEIRSVLDLRRILNLSDTSNRADGYVVLVKLNAAEVGLRVDEVDRIEMVPPEATTDAVGATTKPDGSLAIVRTPGRATILNIEAVLSRVNG